MKGLMKIILGVVIAGVLLIGGCAVIVGSALDSDTSSDKSTSGKQSKSGGSSEGSEAKSSDPSVIGNWKIENFKQLKFGQEYGMFKSVDLRVRNTSDGADTPWFEIRLTDAKGDLVAEYDCVGDEYEAGQGGTVRCSSLDDYKPFKDWEIRNAF